jgi:hypothetical protein
MRLICYIFGYLLVFGGLLSVEWKQLDARTVIMASVVERVHQMSVGQAYNPGYVRDAIERAGEEIWERTAPWFLTPAWAIAGGAILIDIGARRKQPPKVESMSK